ncbi:DUF1127 domain-containing protein [Marinomonas epiphytica]
MMIIALLAHIQNCFVDCRTRRQLARLSAQHLKDVGLSKEQQAVEANKAKWTKVLKQIAAFRAANRRL